MKRNRLTLWIALVLLVSALAAIIGTGMAAASRSEDDDHEGNQATCRPAQGETVTMGTARLIIEYNATDDDIGVHGAFEDHGWSELCVYNPNGRQVLAVGPRAQLQDLTMAGIFFESREPPASEFSFADLKANFPEGQYEVRGTNTE